MPKIYFKINIPKVFFCVLMFIFSWIDYRQQMVRLSDVIIVIWLFSKHHCWYFVIITKYLTVKVRVLCKYYSKSCLFIIDCHFFFKFFDGIYRQKQSIYIAFPGILYSCLQHNKPKRWSGLLQRYETQPLHHSRCLWYRLSREWPLCHLL